MPVEIGIWRLGENIEKIAFDPTTPYEERLEDILADDISVLDVNLLLIGRQVLTSFGKFVDLLAMDADGNLVVIELKRDQTSRDTVGQLLDYGSWARELEDGDIATIFDSYLRKYRPQITRTSLDEAFCEWFGVKEMPESLNDSHELVVVASELDNSTERIVNYLGDEYGVAINAVYFRFFRDGDNQYLSRVWLIDPGEVGVKVTEPRDAQTWNGEFYVSFGESKTRRWSDAQQHSYIAAGGGLRYSRPLYNLEIGGRIWVNVPGTGYVGVGKVLEEAKPITEFTLPDAGGNQVPITQIVKHLPNTDKSVDELEHFVRVDWIKAVPLEEAVKEKGFFGNQNIVARPKARTWRHTVERLKKRWGIGG